MCIRRSYFLVDITALTNLFRQLKYVLEFRLHADRVEHNANVWLPADI